MKKALAIVLVSFAFAVPAFAQDQSAIAAAQSACGPKDTNFDAKQDKNQHPTPRPAPGKALVYVVQDLGEAQASIRALIRVGMDGAWVGANQHGSYFFFNVEPGEHHLCANWQSRNGDYNKLLAMANFTAEAGGIYYFQSRLFVLVSRHYFDFVPVDGDQGKFLVASSTFSVSHPKK